MSNYNFHISSNHQTDGLENFHFSFDENFGKHYGSLQGANYSIVSFDGPQIGAFPIVLKSYKSLFKTLRFLYNPLNTNGSLFSPTEEFDIITAFLSFVKKDEIADRVEEPTNWMLFQSVPNEAKNVPFGSYKIDLQKGVEEVWKGMHSKHRNVIRNAEKKSCVVKTGKEQLKNFYQLYHSTMGRSNLYCEPLSYFEDLSTSLKSNLFTAVVYQEENPIGGICGPFSNFGFSYLYGASADKISVTGAINFLHFETMKKMIAHGVKTYDFVGARLSDVTGTKLAGIQNFKKRFGGNLEEGYLWKIDLNKRKCKVFDSLLAGKMKLKGVKLSGGIIEQELKKIG